MNMYTIKCDEIIGFFNIDWKYIFLTQIFRYANAINDY